jgi:hypothetical protein
MFALLAAPVAGELLASVLPIRVLQAQLTVNPLSFCTGCCRLAEHLDLQLPPVAGEALLLRAVMDLGLPVVSVRDGDALSWPWFNRLALAGIYIAECA